NNASVRFVQASDCSVDLGLFDPNVFSSTAAPDYVSNIRVSGSSVGNTLSSLETVHYTDSELSAAFTEYYGAQGTGPLASTDAPLSSIGSVWGKAFQPEQKRLFVGSTLWRHAGFASGHGPGTMYLFDYTNGSPASMLGSVEFQGVTPMNGGPNLDFGSVCRGGGCENDPGNTGVESDYTLPDDATVPNIDLDAFAKAGKVGFGALDYDANGDKIWAINLAQKGIIEIDASQDLASLTGNIKQYLITGLPNVPVCTGGELRPWAIQVHKGKGYVGCLCDGLASQDTADMDAYVLSFDLANPAAGFTNVFSFPLSYDKNGDDWNPWSDTDMSTGGNWKHYAQPILSAIEFDEADNMYLSFMDRWGIQAGYDTHPPVSGTASTSEKAQSSGELFKVCNTNGTLELEGTGACPTNYPVTNEFFNDKAGDAHNEGAGGALCMLQGSKQLLVQLVDPHPEGDTGSKYWSTQGVNTFSTVDGSVQNWYSNVFSGTEEYNGKGVGMGDIELLLDPAPVEVGNYVWNDTNKNGVQDPDEVGLANVQVDLLDSLDNVLAQATTNANGYYIFSNDPSGTTTASHVYNISTLKAHTKYKLRIANAQGSSQQAALAGLVLTNSDTGAGPNMDLNDNDATLAGNDAMIVVQPTDIQSVGSNNHSFDIGFKLVDYDWGDLPDVAAGTAAGDYESLAANNGPRHIIDPNIRLGSTNTSESDALQNSNADGDTDDGLTLSGNENWVPGQTLSIPFSATNTTGSTAQLEAWIDWNGDGDFDDAGEMVADLDDAASFPPALLITVPTNALQSQPLGFRVRISTTDNMTPLGEISNGEVEDYLITVSCPASSCLPTTWTKH
ncbi:MAG TPA: hypothetical protein ENK85_03430, partial [Saprospiraceae bacterium]|nr:hypothetical protein [Saprospiraceae bacterium]